MSRRTALPALPETPGDLEGARQVLLEAAHLEPSQVVRAVKTVLSALEALNRFGTPEWDARLAAARLLLDLAGAGTKGGRKGGPGVTINLGIAEWARPPASQVIDVTPRQGESSGEDSSPAPTTPPAKHTARGYGRHGSPYTPSLFRARPPKPAKDKVPIEPSP